MCPSGLDSGPKRYRRSIGPKDNGPRGNFTTLRAHVCRDFGGVEALGEPAMDVGQYRLRFFATGRIAEQPSEARRGAQLPHPRTLRSSDLSRAPERAFG